MLLIVCRHIVFIAGIVFLNMKVERVRKKLGFAIRQIREGLGLSQEELAFQSDLHRTYIGSVERGERNISIVNIAKVAKALQVSSSKLLAKAGL